MFGKKFVFIIFGTLCLFIIAVNIYYWSTAISLGSDYSKVEFVGFKTFFDNFSRMPKFEYFLMSIEDVAKVFTEWNSALKGWLAVVTLGVSVVAEFVINVSKVVIMLFVEFIRYFIWLLGFIGVRFS